MVLRKIAVSHVGSNGKLKDKIEHNQKSGIYYYALECKEVYVGQSRCLQFYNAEK